jgi:lambda family phage portal protein
MSKPKLPKFTGKSPLQIKPTMLDRLAFWVDPVKGMKRIQSRASLQALEDTGFIVPGSSRRAVKAWRPRAGTADQDMIPKLDASRRGCRDLSMNSPIAVSALNRELTNVVGSGLNLQARIDRNILGIDDDSAEAWERLVERKFQLWAKSTYCDAERTSTFNELQGIALYNTSLSGDVFALLPYIPNKVLPYGITVKLVESDFCANPFNMSETTSLAGGVQVDANGAPVKYYFKKPKPGTLLTSIIADSQGLFDYEAIDAFSESGRRQVHHLFHKKRPGQRRGMPMLAPVVEVLKQITRLTEAELMASVVTSFFTVFIKTQPQTGGMGGGFVPADQVSGTSTPVDDSIYEMGNGTIIELGGEGQDISIADPKRPNAAFEPFFVALVKQIGAAIEIPFEQLMLYFSSSYSAARGVILEAWKFYRMRRNWLAVKFCQPIYEAWLEEAVSIGDIYAPGFFEDPLLRQAWCGSRWGGPGQGQINPNDETNAAISKIQNYLSTYEDEYEAIHGSEGWHDSLIRNSREVFAIKKAGLPVPQAKVSTPEVPQKPESGQPTAPENNEEEDEEEEE